MPVNSRFNQLLESRRRIALPIGKMVGRTGLGPPKNPLRGFGAVRPRRPTFFITDMRVVIVARDSKLLAPKQFAFSAVQLNECGRMVGGWLKSPI